MMNCIKLKNARDILNHWLIVLILPRHMISKVVLDYFTKFLISLGPG